VNTWKRGCTTGAAQRPRERQVPSGDGQRVLEELQRATHRCGVPEEARRVSGYEAGREGVWLPRFVATHGVEHGVVDSASIEVHRRHRRAKTVRLDVPQLLAMRLRHAAGERQVWSVVRVPSGGAEDGRQRHRERLTAKRDRTRVIKRLKGLLAGYGVRRERHGEVAAQLAQGRPWAGSPLPPALRARRHRAGQKACLLSEPMDHLEAERREAWRTSAEPAVEQVRQLLA
jgi:transposase